MERSFFMLLFLASLAFASISNWNQEFKIDENGIVDGVITITTDNPDSLVLSFSDDIGYSKVVDEKLLQVPYAYINSTLFFSTQKNRPTMIFFKTDSFTSKESDKWKFNMSISSNKPIKKMSSKTKLITNEIKSTNGQIQRDGTLVFWEKNDVPENTPMIFLISYYNNYIKSDLIQNNANPPALQNNWFAPGNLILILICILIYYFYTKLVNQKNPPNKIHSFYTVNPKNAADDKNSYNWKLLEPEEREIIQEIIRMDGKCTQRHLQTFTKLPKSTLSRRIKKLERKDLIEVIQKGNTNVIALKDNKKESKIIPLYY